MATCVSRNYRGMSLFTAQRYVSNPRRSFRGALLESVSAKLVRPRSKIEGSGGIEGIRHQSISALQRCKTEGSFGLLKEFWDPNSKELSL